MYICINTCTQIRTCARIWTNQCIAGVLITKSRFVKFMDRILCVKWHFPSMLPPTPALKDYLEVWPTDSLSHNWPVHQDSSYDTEWTQGLSEYLRKAASSLEFLEKLEAIYRYNWGYWGLGQRWMKVLKMGVWWTLCNGKLLVGNV